MWERILVILRKELIQALRDPRMRVLLFLPPMIQLVVFGFAVNLDVDHARIAWMDMDRTPLSRDLRERFEGSGRFDVVAMPRNEDEVHQVLDHGNAEAVIRVLPDFERDIHRGKATQVQILIDGTNSNTASIVGSYAGEIIAEFSNDVMAGQQNVRILTRSPDFGRERNVSLGAGAHACMVQSGPAQPQLFRARRGGQHHHDGDPDADGAGDRAGKEIGTMEQLMVTPIRPIELMLGKTLPFAVVGLLDVVLITAAALLVFHIPMRGSPLLLLFCSVLFLMTSLGAGLFLSTVSQTQQQAMMANFFFSTPAFMLSGFAFPIRNMPVAVQYLTYLNPLRYFIEIVRGIFLKGVGATVLWPQMAALFVYGVTVLGLSALRFHKTLD